MSDKSSLLSAQSSTAPQFRFAPSPNGWLHLGHAFSALTIAARARAAQGRILLRIEDVDIGRTRPEYIEGIYQDLEWIGLNWEGPVRRQSTCFPSYEAALQQLRAMDLLYPCFATRKEIIDTITQGGVPLDRWPRDPDGGLIYPGIYKDITQAQRSNLLWEGRTFAWRLDMPKAKVVAEKINGGPIIFQESGPQNIGAQKTNDHITCPINPERFGDVILARKDVPTSYHIAVVVDDADQGVTDVVRGQDLFPATDIHRLLQVLLGLPAPRYHHHRLIRDETGRRLAKSARDQGIRELRQQGLSPDNIRDMIGL
ncbi:MAG: tRNA glutamyl-Q(34) synthetase GluQRS [Parvibaculaceae bacterium]|nr:tRNA glutamyl-Q(34) synthetase GluQRS [Parvibaculaceae bacterium]